VALGDQERYQSPSDGAASARYQYTHCLTSRKRLRAGRPITLTREGASP
jgi:hypothetical protein